MPENKFRITQEDWVFLRDDVKQIKHALMGDYEKQGFIGNTKTRLADLEEWKGNIAHRLSIVFKCVVAALCSGAVGGIGWLIVTIIL